MVIAHPRLGWFCFDPARQLLIAYNQSRGNGSSGGHQGGIGQNNYHQAHQKHSQTFSTWSYETDRMMLLEAMYEMVRKLLGDIYGCKGVVYAAEAPEHRAVLQVVGRRSYVTLYDEWVSKQVDPHQVWRVRNIRANPQVAVITLILNSTVG